jgi:hypothetical protein
MMTGTWLWAIILQKRFYDAETRPILDWGDEDYPATFLFSFFWCLEARDLNSVYTGLLASIVLIFPPHLITQAFCEVLKLLAKLSLGRKFSRQHYTQPQFC